jgi:hypothetical protein
MTDRVAVGAAALARGVRGVRGVRGAGARTGHVGRGTQPRQVA